MKLDFKVGDKVEWPEFTGADGYPIEAGKGIVVGVHEHDEDGMNYEVLEDGTGDTWYPYNAIITRAVDEPNAMSNKTLNGNDLGKVVRVPTRTGLVVQGTLRKVSHAESEIVVGFEETSSTYYADVEGSFEYV